MLAAAAAAVVLAVLALNSTHHVVVVRTVARDRAASADQSAGHVPKPPGEYPAAKGAASLQSVRAALAAEEHGGSGAAAEASHTSHGLLSDNASSSFARLQAGLPGHVELSVVPLGAGAREALGGDAAAHGWSTTKVPVLAALLRARGPAGLTPREQSLAQSAITESNNESILALFGDLEHLEGGLDGASEYIDELLRSSGDDQTVVATASPPAGAVTTFGQTEWSPGEAVKFFRALALGCLLPSDQTAYVLGLMQRIEPSESWGLGSAGFRSVAFKGGWGPENGGYLVRQSGVIDVGSSSAAAVAIVAVAPSFGAGAEMLTRTATWLRQHLQLAPRAKAGCERP